MWHEEHLGVPFQSDPNYQKAFVIWLRHYVQTELNDRRFAGQWSVYDDNCWLPFDPAAALQARSALARTYFDLSGIPKVTIEAAKNDACKYSYKTQVKLLEEYEQITD